MAKQEPKRGPGRPAKADLTERTMIRFSKPLRDQIEEERKRLEGITGQEWNEADYFRLAAEKYLGQHLAKVKT